MDKLRTRRDTIKTKVFRISKFVKEKPLQPEADKVESLLLYQGKLDALLEAFKDFSAIQRDIYKLLNVADEKLVTEFDDYTLELEDEFYSTKAKLAFFVSICHPAEETRANESFADKTIMDQFLEQQSQLITELGRRTNGTNDVKLHPLKIPQFAGDYKDWVSFFDIYNTAVHQNMKLSPAQKLQYLKESLTGSAAQLIKHITITDANYDLAWDMLVKRFDKKQHVVFSLIKIFMDQTKVSTPSTTNIREVLNTTQEVTRSLAALGTDYETRDPWLIFLVLEKLDSETRKLWATKVLDLAIPKLSDLLEFIENRCDAMDTFCETEDSSSSFNKGKHFPKANVRALHTSPLPTAIIHKSKQSGSTSSSSKSKCKICTDRIHPLYYCPEFKKFHISSRQQFIVSNNCCSVCLSFAHVNTSCSSQFNCRICHERHHTLLHVPRANAGASSSTNQSSTTSSDVSSLTSTITSHLVNNTLSVCGLLPTAVVYAKDSSGGKHLVRVLLDSGAQMSFISEDCIQRLGLTREKARIDVNGFASADAGVTRGKSLIELSSQYDDKSKMSLTVLVMQKLTSSLPSESFKVVDWDAIKTVQLADPNFNKSMPIDIVIGSNKFMHLLRNGEICNSDESLIAKNTVFGWVVSGELDFGENKPSIIGLNAMVQESVHEDIQRFWKIEEISDKPMLTQEEEDCIDHFEKSHERDISGRYVVRLPFKDSADQLGDSLGQSISRLLSIERTFRKNDDFYREYKKTLDEYLIMNHMEKVPSSELQNKSCYLPHHAVIKETSSTTKLRVVFDASASSSTGVSLNQKLMIGPTIQKDLFTTILCFRSHEYAFSGDIEKMYRQILVHKDDTDYQRIVWRSSLDGPIEHFRLKTVTFGTASAPFLATKALHQIGKEHMDSSPDASHIIQNHFYVDDLLSGHNDLDKAIQLQGEICEILASCGFRLRKWTSNHPKLLENIEIEDRGMDLVNLTEDLSIKTLGIGWKPSSDVFAFHVSLPPLTNITKRQLLSDSSKLFDPLGFLAPTIVLCKILFQQLWLLNLNWDDDLPIEIADKWLSIRSSLPKLMDIKIPRWIPNYSTLELHGFCDASESAYAAVIYSRSVNGDGIIKVNLVASKTKVAPLKQVSIPRLELCGAVLLVNLMNQVKAALSHLNLKIFCHTDSMIVLSWLAAPPRRWSTFVGNRTSEIITAYPSPYWSHISSKNNPADIASRGLLPAELIQCSMWWNGPAFLATDVSTWPPPKTIHIVDKSEMEVRKTVNIFNIQDLEPGFVLRFSSLERLKRITALLFRFKTNCCLSIKNKKDQKLTTFLSTAELSNALHIHIKASQQNAFPDELTLLKQQKSVAKSSKLSSLHPFIDDKGLIRVGGRLSKSDLSYSAQHPVILSNKEHITTLIIESIHERFFHPNFTLLTSILFQTYSVLGYRDLVRKCIHKCITCFKNKSKLSSQMMGDLPTPRITEARAFSNVGCDYAGPVWLKRNSTRSAAKDKAYIAVFVCMVTKAVHLEVVSSLSTPAFIATLKRFAARRGFPINVYSDNGTNFVGASKDLKELFALIVSEEHQDAVVRHSSSQGTQWHFNPPSAPHMGGLWEASVKSMKYHLHRSMKESILTFEEITTLLAQIEAVLNSRPLCQLSSDPQDTLPLTPAHFLIGAPLTAMPEPDIGTVTSGRLHRWKQVQNIHMNFWKRWRLEYLNTLNQRNKWKTEEDNLKVGDLVLMNISGIRSNEWPTGRVINVFPGTDGRVRVVTVRGQGGEYKRPVHKLCKLPIE